MAHLYASFADASLAGKAAGALLDYGAGRSVGNTGDEGVGDLARRAPPYIIKQEAKGL